MTRPRTSTARRATTGLALIGAVGIAALVLAPVDDDTAGYAVARVPSGLAVAADPTSTPIPAPTSVPSTSPGPGPPTDSAPVPPARATLRAAAPPPAPATPAPATSSPAAAPIDPCPPPPSGAVPPEAATAQVGAPPRPGTYEYLVQPAGAAAPRAEPDRWVVTATAPDSWDITVPVDGGWSATSALRLRDDAIELTSWTLRQGDRSTTVRPLLPVPDLVLPASAGTTWDETSYDLDTRVAVRSTGRYLERQAVPLCGALVDAWKAETTLAITPLPAADAPTVTVTATRWVATQRGGLVARAAQRIDAAAAGGEAAMEGTWFLRGLDSR